MPRISTLPLLLAATSLPAQATWTQVSPTPIPSARTNYGFCSDVVSLWLFGGNGGPSYLNDTWRYLAGTWQQLAPTNSPPARVGGRMVYDFNRGRLVLFGGKLGPSAHADDTWEFVNNDWQQVTTATKPPALFRFRMVYDSQRSVVLLFGGEDSAGGRFGDTWTYDGTNWTQLSPAASPSARSRHAMCYNSETGDTILFGGETPRNNETWKWDGTNWAQLTPTTSPPPTNNANLIYDSVRDRVVLFGGQDNTPTLVDTTWEFDGLDWVQRTPATSPNPRSGAPLAFLELDGKVYMHGGYNRTPLGDMWSYSTSDPATFDIVGSGCRGAAGTPTLTGTKPWLGDTFLVTVTNLPSTAPTTLILGFSDQTFGGVNLPLDLAFLGAPGCRIYNDIIFQFPMANGGGTATFSAPLPAAAALSGFPFYAQAWAADPTANFAGLIVSNQGAGRGGTR